jgi:hypothetical protein
LRESTVASTALNTASAIASSGFESSLRRVGSFPGSGAGAVLVGGEVAKADVFWQNYLFGRKELVTVL